MPSAQEVVEAKIAATPVVVYSKSYCPYCSKTKALLKELGASFEVVELDQINDGDDQQSALEAITGQRTVPNTFIGGKTVGGNSDIQKLHKNNQLVDKLKAVSAFSSSLEDDDHLLLLSHSKRGTFVHD
ncbi:Glutaredoxin, partial [Globisporangium splendens]